MLEERDVVYQEILYALALKQEYDMIILASDTNLLHNSRTRRR